MGLRRAATVVAGVGFAVGVAVPAFATVTPAGGGTWSYGITASGTVVYSNYIHPSVTHRASTINYWGEYSCHDNTKGKWANDSQRADPIRGHVDHAYWAKTSCP